MTTPAQNLVILGNNLTALAVARAAYRQDLRPVLFDHEPGLAFKTRLATKVVCQSRDDDDILAQLTSLAPNRHLIAVSDDWIRFIVRHRERLDTAFDRVLHASNETLVTCLDKDRFAVFCRENGLPSPGYHGDATELAEEELRFPVMIRPGRSSVALGADLPKAAHIEDLATFRLHRERLRGARVPGVVTQSLLNQRLRKYSVGLARTDGRMVSYVAEQARPAPEDCAAGTYVRLSPDTQAEQLARTCADLLDYYGIGEIEILHSLDDGAYYLIEFNARPWLQYALAEDTNHRMLQFLLETDAYEPDKEIKAGKNWLWFEADLFVCFARSTGYIRQGRIGHGAYVRSVFGSSSRAVFCWQDPMPAIHSIWQTLGGPLQKRLGRLVGFGSSRQNVQN